MRVRLQADRARTTPARLRSSVPADARHYETDPDVAKVTCGSCKRNREYATATAATAPPVANATPGPERQAPQATPPASDAAVPNESPEPGARAAAVPGPGTRAPTGPPPTWPLPLTAPPWSRAAARAALTGRTPGMEEDRARREADAAGPLPLPDLDQLRQPTARATAD